MTTGQYALERKRDGTAAYFDALIFLMLGGTVPELLRLVADAIAQFDALPPEGAPS